MSAFLRVTYTISQVLVGYLSYVSVVYSVLVAVKDEEQVKYVSAPKSSSTLGFGV